MKEKKTRRARFAAAFMRMVKLLPIVLVLGIVAISIYLFFIAGVPYEAILNFTPDNYTWTAILLIVIYAVKSLSVIFPIVILYIWVGSIYPIWGALLVNLAGLAATLVVPYFVGRISGTDLLDHLSQKYSKLTMADQISPNSQFFSSFFLRIISILPADIISMLMGARAYRFPTFFLGSMLGCIPSMITTTYMGATITEPGSPAFIISTTITILLVLASVVLYKYTVKK